jgi:hypothetical protein
MGCSSSFKSEGDFLKWMNEPENGYVKRTSANGFSISLKYLPPEYLGFIEMKKGDVKVDVQSLIKEFDGSRTFLLTLEHEVSGVDVTNYNINNVPEFKERMNELNFQIKDYLSLKTKEGQTIRPVLTTFENLYEIGDKKSFYVVFTKEDEVQDKPEELDIVFHDPFFDTGINHFVFKTKDIDNVPDLKFIN